MLLDLTYLLIMFLVSLYKGILELDIPNVFLISEDMLFLNHSLNTNAYCFSVGDNNHVGGS